MESMHHNYSEPRHTASHFTPTKKPKSSSEGSSPYKSGHQGDRFISTRTVDSEPYNNFDTKSEIFSQSSQMNLYDKMSSSGSN